MTPAALTAVIWDFDNTLVDTLLRNFRVTRSIVSDVTRRDPDEFGPLRSVDEYDAALHRTSNWQELYERELGLDPDVTARAGALWTRYQRADLTPIGFFDGIAATLEQVAPIPQAIVSLNCRLNIATLLEEAGLRHRFELIIGYEEVEYHRQKPAPDGLLICLERLTAFRPGRVLYIGDHRTDVECARNAGDALTARGVPVEVISVQAAYGSPAAQRGERWSAEPRHVAGSPGEVAEIARSYASSDA